jgi:hypothetical protein
MWSKYSSDSLCVFRLRYLFFSRGRYLSFPLSFSSACALSSWDCVAFFSSSAWFIMLIVTIFHLVCHSIIGSAATEYSADAELSWLLPLVLALCVLYLLRCVPLFWTVILNILLTLSWLFPFVLALCVPYLLRRVSMLWKVILNIPLTLSWLFPLVLALYVIYLLRCVSLFWEVILFSQKDKEQAEETEKEREQRSRSRDFIGWERKGEKAAKPNDSVKSLLRSRDSVGRVSVK